MTGTIIDYGHPVSLRANNRRPEVVENRILTWTFRLFRAKTHSLDNITEDMSKLFDMIIVHAVPLFLHAVNKSDATRPQKVDRWFPLRLVRYIRSLVVHVMCSKFTGSCE